MKLKHQQKSVVSIIDTEHKKQVEENCHYLKTICEVIRLAATQNIAL